METSGSKKQNHWVNEDVVDVLGDGIEICEFIQIFVELLSVWMVLQRRVDSNARQLTKHSRDVKPMFFVLRTTWASHFSRATQISVSRGAMSNNANT